ncbi:MAG: 50S ribosomal protein L10 [Candidatus Nanohaloarchaea archaeon]|nr:50S ribosomal protein L10 [Candidatus Nanohaloarchaea archaeon]
MKLTRQDKEAIVSDLQDRIDSSNVVGILDMHSLPAKQLQEIRKEMTDEADIRMARKSLMHLALEQSEKENIEDLKDNRAIQPAFIFSDSNPFTLYQTIQEKKSSAPASGGEIAPSDIVIEEGDTGLGPGPMIGRLQSLGAQTSVEDGSIKVTQEAVAVEAGEEITPDTAEILNKLGMEPLEVGLDLKLVHEDGEVLGKDVLAIDTDEYRQDIEAGVSQAFNLAVNASYINSLTAKHIIVEQLRKTRNFAVNAALAEEEVIEDILRKAASEAEGLDAQLDLENVEIEEEDESEETDSSDENTGEEPDETQDEDDGTEESSEEGESDSSGTEDDTANNDNEDANQNGTDSSETEED